MTLNQAVRAIVLPHILAETAAHPPLTNREIAEVVREALPDSRTTEASVASTRSMEAARRPKGEVVPSPRNRMDYGHMRRHVLSRSRRPETASDEVIAAMPTHAELAPEIREIGLGKPTRSNGVASARVKLKQMGYDIVGGSEIRMARKRRAVAETIGS